MTTTTATKTATARYTLGQVVEVLAYDFSLPGYPLVWQRATIAEVTQRENGMWNVQVVTPAKTYHPQIVGKRGGNPKLREMAA